MIDKKSYYRQRQCYRLALFATLLAFFVILLGAYTRLTDAGLGCPDWPGCYGHLTVPKSAQLGHIASQKAWTEMTHRYIAGLLGLIIFALGVLALRNRRYPEQPIALPMVLVILLVFQALLGMWTVTLKLFPLVVMAHLLGGFTTLSLLWWLTLKLKPIHLPNEDIDRLKGLRLLALMGLLVLGSQLFLGGWTSANYAALVCLDFPACTQGEFFPLGFNLKAFNIFSAGVEGSQGTLLDHSSRITIHMIHRLGAIVTTLVVGWLAFQVFGRAHCIALRALSVLIAVLLTIQLLLGVTNVLAVLPLPIAIAHNAIAAILLLSLVTLNYYIFSHPRRYYQQTQPPTDTDRV
jgi:cytochrome c oxidase assembly protein subunit 15